MVHYYHLTICYSSVYILKYICMLLSAIKQGLCNTEDHHSNESFALFPIWNKVSFLWKHKSRDAAFLRIYL